MKRLLSCLFAALLVCSASVASAQDDGPDPISPIPVCEDDADCPADQICQLESIVNTACEPCVEDPDGESECPPCDDDGGIAYGECVDPPTPSCLTDADCAEGDVCLTYTYEACSGGGFDGAPPCPADEECTVPDPEPTDDVECTEMTESVCVPPYLAPCELDSDCGPGFICEELEMCSCSGGVPAVSPDDPDDDAPLPEPDCSCEPAGEFYCELDRVECESDADCDPALDCTTAPGRSGAIDVGSPDCAEGDECEPVAIPDTDDESYCAPEGYFAWGGGEGSPAERLAESVGIDSDDFQSSDRVNWGGESAGAGEKSSAGGCSAAGGAPGSVFGLLMLAGMLLRRRN